MNKLQLYGEIGYDITAKGVAEKLASFSDLSLDLEIEIYSPGGDYFEGLLIADLIEKYEGQTIGCVKGLAASMATYVLMKCDKVKMDSDAYFMIHNPIGSFYGDYKKLESKIDLLKKLASDMAQAYADKTGRDIEEIETMMNAETWLSAGQALEMGFIDEIEETEMRVAALVDEKFLKNAPQSVVKAFQKNQTKTPNTEEDIMKNELIKVLALSEKSEEKEIISAVTVLNEKITALTNDLDAKKELVNGLSEQIEAKAKELDSIQAKILAYESDKVVAKLLEDNKLLISDEVKAKLEKRVIAYLNESDAEAKAEKLEDLTLYVKAKGVPVKSANTDSNSRVDFSSKDNIGYEEKLVAKIEEIMQEKKYKPSDYVKAMTEAKELLKGDK